VGILVNQEDSNIIFGTLLAFIPWRKEAYLEDYFGFHLDWGLRDCLEGNWWRLGFANS